LLQPPPSLDLVIVRDTSPPADGFLWIVRRHYRVVQPGGRTSPVFIYDVVDRRARDAVVIVAHCTVEGSRCVYLRTALRPPITLRVTGSSPVTEAHAGNLWELPAGLIEPAEALDLAGVRRAAARELREELGFDVTPDDLQELGPSVFPAPGMIAERQFFFAVEVDPSRRSEPELDGSVLEEAGSVAMVEIGAALRMCREGLLPDSKTELALRRFAEQWVK
jgi:ADP-ribose pyrophosphatase